MRVPVERWHDPRTGRSVTLVKMAHAGSPAYYDAVRALAERLEQDGAEVHVEGVNDPPAGAGTDAERALLVRLRAALDRRHDAAARLLGRGQLDGLQMRPSWRNTDVNGLDLLLAQPDPARYVADVEASAARLDGIDRDRALRAWVWVAQRLTRLISGMGTAHDRRNDAGEIELRDAAAARAILATDRDVVVLWGAMHTAGIGRALHAAGFRRIRRPP